jgi:hypothetical protein
VVLLVKKGSFPFVSVCFRSFRFIQSRYRFCSLAPSRDSNSRSGWLQQIVNYEKNGNKRKQTETNGEGEKLREFPRRMPASPAIDEEHRCVWKAVISLVGN